MRNFNSFEQQIITAIVEARKNLLIENIDLSVIILNGMGKHGLVWTLDEIFLTFNSPDKTIYFIFFDLMFLLRDLENAGLAYIIRANGIESKKKIPITLESVETRLPNGTVNRIIKDTDKKKLSYYTLHFRDLATQLERYSMSQIIPSPELVELVNNGFVSKEHKWHKEQIKKANINTFIAIASFIVAMAALIITYSKPITINDEQINLINQSIKELNISKPLNLQITTDTIQVKVIPNMPIQDIKKK